MILAPSRFTSPRLRVYLNFKRMLSVSNEKNCTNTHETSVT
jgi:hypothetical protein